MAPVPRSPGAASGNSAHQPFQWPLPSFTLARCQRVLTSVRMDKRWWHGVGEDPFRPPPAGTPRVRGGVIGDGASGAGLGAWPRQAGESDFAVLERAFGAGGTRCGDTSLPLPPPPPAAPPASPDNRASGPPRGTGPTTSACAPTSPGGEALRTRGAARVLSWAADTTGGVLVGATGAPPVPGIPAWPMFPKPCSTPPGGRGYELAGKRVAVVGTDASAIPFAPQPGSTPRFRVAAHRLGRTEHRSLALTSPTTPEEDC